jgi:hypothetical protein
MISLRVLREQNEKQRFERLRRDDSRTAPADATALADELRRRVRGEVRFDAGSRALYATDGSNYRQVPIGVVIPRDAGDVEETLTAARRFGAPVLSRGGGTSLAGQCCNVAVVRLLLHLGIWLCYVLGAVLGAVAQLRWGLMSMALPVVCLLLATLCDLAWPLSPQARGPS